MKIAHAIPHVGLQLKKIRSFYRVCATMPISRENGFLFVCVCLCVRLCVYKKNKKPFSLLIRIGAHTL